MTNGLKGLMAGLASTLLLSSCSVKTMALRTTAGILSEASAEIETETNWLRFKAGVPAALKTLEGLLYIEPENTDLLVAVTKAYGAYGFGVYETLHLKEKFKDADHQPNKAQALDYYKRSITYGLRWLQVNNISIEVLRNAIKSGKGSSLLDSNLDSSSPLDLDGAFFLGQSWLSYINLQRDQPALVAQTYIVKSLFDWVCQKNPEFKQGACNVFYGAYAASRPKMLGGNPAEGKRIFEKAIKKYPDNLFLRVSFMEHYIIPFMNESLYKKQKSAMLAAANKPEPVLIPGTTKISLESTPQKGQIFNTIALQRFRIIRQNESEIF